MPRLTMKTFNDTIKALTEDVKLRFSLHHEQIMALCHDRDYLREELSNVSYCLAQQLTINDLHSDQIQHLTQLAKEQAETIQRLSRWNNEATRRILALEKTTKQLDENMNDVARHLASLFLASDTLEKRLSELAGDHTALCRAVEDIGDEEALSHQWLDRQQQRIVALERKVK